MIGMDGLGDSPILRRPACLGSHAVLVHVQFMERIAWAAYVVYISARACMYALYLCNIFGMDSLGDEQIVRRPPGAWARTLYLYPYSIWYGQPERRT